MLYHKRWPTMRRDFGSGIADLGRRLRHALLAGPRELVMDLSLRFYEPSLRRIAMRLRRALAKRYRAAGRRLALEIAEHRLPRAASPYA